MSKVAILNDTHFGVRNGSDVFLDYQEAFFRDGFFPECEKQGISQVIHLGDFFDHRKYVNYKVLKRTREMLLDPLCSKGMVMHIIPGNHDTYWKNTNELNSLTEQLSHHENISVHMKPNVQNFWGLDVGLVPWITTDNEDECLDFLKTAPAPVVMGHFEIGGFRYIANSDIMSHGMDRSKFSRFEMVLSGHYHTGSKQGNIRYLGTQYQLTWSDSMDSKGFHVLDTSTRKIRKVFNPQKLFHHLVYDDTKPISKPTKDIRGGFVKVAVQKKEDTKMFDSYIDQIQAYDPFDLKIIESFREFAADSVSDNDVSLEDTPTLLASYVDAIETDLDKNTLKSRVQGLFAAAQDMDAV